MLTASTVFPCPGSVNPSLQPGPSPRFSAGDFRKAMGQFASGVVVISTTTENAGAHAMTANAFMSGSLNPPLVIVSVAHTARMHAEIEKSRMFGVSVLAHDQSDTSNHFAGKPCSDSPAFEMLSAVPVIAHAAMQLTAVLRHIYPCGDHTLFVGEVSELRVPEQHVPPLLFHRGRYGRLLAGIE